MERKRGQGEDTYGNHRDRASRKNGAMGLPEGLWVSHSDTREQASRQASPATPS